MLTALVSRHPFGALILACGLSVIIVTILGMMTFGSITDHPKGNPHIEEVKLRLVDGLVILNVSLNADMSCKEIYQSLNIQPIIVRGRTYVPVCTFTDQLSVQIQYRNE